MLFFQVERISCLMCLRNRRKTSMLGRERYEGCGGIVYHETVDGASVWSQRPGEKFGSHSRCFEKSLQVSSQDWYNLNASWGVILNIKLRENRYNHTGSYWPICVWYVWQRKNEKEKEIAHAPLKNKKLSIVNENLSYLCYLGNLSLVCKAIPATRKLREYNHTEDNTCTTYTTEDPSTPPMKSSSNEWEKH